MLRHNNSLPVFTAPFQYLSKKPLSSEDYVKSRKSVSPQEILGEMKQLNLKLSYDPSCVYARYRKLVIDWIFEIGESFELSFNTILIGIRLLDSIALRFKADVTNYNNVAGIVLMIAAKFQEPESKIPKISEMMRFFPDYTKKDVIELEKIILRKLNWELNVLTPMHFVDIYTEIGAISSSECSQKNVSTLSKRFQKYCEFFVDLCTQEKDFLRFDIEKIAIACIAASRKIIGLRPWSVELENMSCIPLSSTCFKLLWSFYCKHFSNSKSNDKENYNN